MTEVVILNEADLRRCVALDLDAIGCVEGAFEALARGEVAMPPVLRLDLPAHHGEVDVKTAWLPALERFAIKVSPGFFDNPARGLPSLNGLMILLSAHTGLLEALLLDNGYLTAVRTAAAGAVAARWLARRDARHAAIIGAGEQARLQLLALARVRPLESASVWAPRAAQAEAFAARLSAELDRPVRACTSIDAAVAEADIVVTTTPSTTPLIHARHLRPGMHVTAMGSDAEHKNELAADVFARTDLYACDRLAQVRVLGELHHAVAARQVAADAVFPELGQIIAGQHPGRDGDDAMITVCDLTGTGAQDTAIANLAFARARARGLGTPFHS